MESYLRKNKLTREEVTQKLLDIAPLSNSINLDYESSNYYDELLQKDEFNLYTPPKKKNPLNFSISSTESLFLQDSPYKSIPGSEDKKVVLKEVSDSDGNKAVSSTMSLIDSKSNTIVAGTSDIDQHSLYQSFLSGRDSFLGAKTKEGNLNFIELGYINDPTRDLNFSVMKHLFEEMSKKEESQFKTNIRLHLEKGKIYSKKAYLIFEDQLSLIDGLVSTENLNKISSYLFKGVILCDPYQSFKLYICYNKSGLWEYIKITSSLDPKTQQLNYKIKTVRPYDLGLNVKIMEKTMEDVVLNTFKERKISCSMIDSKSTKEKPKISCSHKETGLYVVKLLSKNLFNFSEDICLRKQVYNVMLDIYFNSPFSH